MHRPLVLFTALLLALIVLTIPGNVLADSEVVVLRPGPGFNDGTDQGAADAGKDTWTYGATSAEANKNRGDWDHLFASPTSTCNTANAFMYLQFDISSLPAIVDSAVLGFTHRQLDVCYSNCTADFYLYPVLEEWNEMTLTYNDPPALGAAVSDPITISIPQAGGLQEYDITKLYNGWKDGTYENHGIAIYSPTEGCNNAAASFYVQSSDDPDESKRPYLKVIGTDINAHYSENLALGKTVEPATAITQGTPHEVVDGTLLTGWYSCCRESIFTIDLGEEHQIGRIDASPWQTWRVRIYSSLDGVDWTLRHELTPMLGSIPVSFAPNGSYSARYFKYEGWADWYQYVGLAEFAVYGWNETAPPPLLGEMGTDNVALGQPTETLNPPADQSSPDNAVDGDEATSWTSLSASQDDAFGTYLNSGVLRVDLGSSKPVGKVSVLPKNIHGFWVLVTDDPDMPPRTAPTPYKIQSYPDLFTTSNTSSEKVSLDFQGAAQGQYVLFGGMNVGTSTPTPLGLSELEVYEWISQQLDLDGSGGGGDALTDGLMLLRYQFGFQGDSLFNGVIGDGATKTPEEIFAYLKAYLDRYDIDGNGLVDALTDGILNLRYLFGFTGETLVKDAVGQGCTRCNYEEVQKKMAELAGQLN